MKSDNPNSSGSKWQRWLKKVGIAGFLFFLIKGLIWLGLMAWFGKAFMD